MFSLDSEMRISSSILISCSIFDHTSGRNFGRKFTYDDTVYPLSWRRSLKRAGWNVKNVEFYDDLKGKALVEQRDCEWMNPETGQTWIEKCALPEWGSGSKQTVVHYRFSADFPDGQKAAVEKYIADLSTSLMCITFEKASPDSAVKNGIEINWTKGYCPEGECTGGLVNGKCTPSKCAKDENDQSKWVGEYCDSSLGMETDGWQTLNLGANCGGRTPSTVHHEILHALGTLHEQQRYDRDDYMAFNPAGPGGFTSQAFPMKKVDAMTSEYGHEFEFESVMIYDSFTLDAFHKEKKTGFGEAPRISTSDALQIQYRYCKKRDANFKYKEYVQCKTPDLAGFIKKVFKDRICDGIIDCPGGEDENGDMGSCKNPTANEKTEKGCCKKLMFHGMEYNHVEGDQWQSVDHPESTIHLSEGYWHITNIWTGWWNTDRTDKVIDDETGCPPTKFLNWNWKEKKFDFPEFYIFCATSLSDETAGTTLPPQTTKPETTEPQTTAPTNAATTSLPATTKPTIAPTTIPMTTAPVTTQPTTKPTTAPPTTGPVTTAGATINCLQDTIDAFCEQYTEIGRAHV